MRLRLPIAFLALAAAVASAAAFEFAPKDRPPVGFNTADSAAGRAVYLNPDYGRYGAGAIPVGGAMPAGEYVFTIKAVGVAEQSAAIGIYLRGEDGKHIGLIGRIEAGKDEVVERRWKGVVDQPFDAVLIKKMDERKAPTVAVLSLGLTSTSENAAVAGGAQGPEKGPEKGWAFAVADMAVAEKSRVEADGKTYVRLSASTGRYGWIALPLGRTLPAGNYRFEGTVFAGAVPAASSALYTRLVSGEQRQAGPVLKRSAPGASPLSFDFSAEGPFDALVLKKMSEDKTDSVGVGDFRLTPVKEMRLRGALEILRRPAPFGIRSEKLRARVADAVAKGDMAATRALVPQVESWRDAVAGALDLHAEFAMLRLAAQGPGGENREDGEGADAIADAQAKVQRRFENIHALLAEIETERAREALPALRRDLADWHAALNRRHGGEANPDYGSNRFGWVKEFSRVTGRELPEYDEPTPWRIDGPDGLALSLRDLNADAEAGVGVGVGGDFESTWTTNTYRYADAVLTFTVIHPVILVDAAAGRVALRNLGAPWTARRLDARTFFLSTGKPSGLLVMAEPEIALLDAPAAPAASVGSGGGGKEKTTMFELSRPGRVGLLFVEEASARAAADFYADKLAALPTRVFQLQKGGTVLQRFSASDGSDAAFAPLSPLEILALASPRPPRFAEEPRRAPGVAYSWLSGAVKEYTLPPAGKKQYRQGVNVWNVDNPAALWRELAEAGCDYIRLVCGADGPKWQEDTLEVQRALLEKNLTAARDAGLKVAIDMHGGWIPPRDRFGAFDGAAYIDEFVARWTAIAEWCRPYRDTLLWYDLMNEPHIFHEHGSVEPYWRLIREVLPRLRAVDADTPFLVEVANMANAVGARHWAPPPDAGIVMGYHDYWPHMFTHQRVPDNGSQAVPDVHYPGFMPMISWTAPSWDPDGQPWYYWDRWKAEGVGYPVLRAVVVEGVAVDCGEFGVVGYASRAELSGRAWLRDFMRRMRKWDFSHSLWGVQGGYVWNVPAFKDEWIAGLSSAIKN